MPKIPIDYSKSVFYKLVSRDLTITEIYVGHTTNFRLRKSQHKNACNSEKSRNYNFRVYAFIRENGGFVNWDMIVIQRQSCVDAYEVCAIERGYIETLGATLNSQVPGRTIEEWREVNKDKIKEAQSTYYKENMDTIKDRASIWYETNKERVIEIQTIYNELNKDKIKENHSIYYKKNRDRLVTLNSIYREANKNKLKERGKTYRDANKEDAKEYNILYRKANKEKLKEKSKIYREANKDTLKEQKKLQYQKRKLLKQQPLEEITNFFV